MLLTSGAGDAGHIGGPTVAPAEGTAGAGKAPSIGKAVGVDGSGGCRARHRLAGKARRP